METFGTTKHNSLKNRKEQIALRYEKLITLNREWKYTADSDKCYKYLRLLGKVKKELAACQSGSDNNLVLLPKVSKEQAATVRMKAIMLFNADTRYTITE